MVDYKELNIKSHDEKTDVTELVIEQYDEEEIEYLDVNISVYRDQYSVFQLKRKIENNLLNIAPDFQRHDVWSQRQKSELIESILMGIPIPVFYFYENELGKQQIVDGKQRISALLDFMNNDLKLKDLKILGRRNGEAFFNGKLFSELELNWQAKIEDYQLTVFVIRPPTPETIKYDIFDRVNRGGTKLNAQEMRHALYNGPSTKLLEQLSNDDNYQKSIGRKDQDDTRMKGRMMILRLIALYLTYEKNIDIKYNSDMNEYLANIMRYLNDSDPSLIIELQDMFTLSMKNCNELFGGDAFRFAKTENSKIRRSINMGLFEMLGYGLALEIPNDGTKRDDLIKFINAKKNEIDDEKLFLRIDSKSIVDLRCQYAKEIQKVAVNIC